jgi:4-hydroxybenzoyl-CoA thioesterase
VGAPFVTAHRVRFDEVDAAGIVYFARFFTWCHDAMDAMLEPIDGGYVGLVRGRGLGLPAVHVEADYVSPARFGDTMRIAVVVERIGRSSVTARFEISHVQEGTPVAQVATVRHIVALTDLKAMKSRPLPDDVRAVLERHLEKPL